MRILFLLFPFLWCSCNNQYHLFQVASENAVQAENGMFSFANEDIQINYDFWSYGGTVWIEVINIGDENLRVYIAESGLVVNGRQMPHLTKQDIVLATENVDFEPKIRVQLNPGERYAFESYPIRQNKWNFPNRTDEVDFTSESSPIKVESYLRYEKRSSFGDQNTLKNQFWASNIERTSRSNFRQKEQQYASGSYFFVFKDYSQFWLNLALALIEIYV
ncbi:MAG: hypothetical protein AAFO82_18080, partial [Bacteroidota bacterium]